MSEPRIIPIEEIEKWILEQPDERELNFSNTHLHKDRCGCIMIEFAKDNDISVSLAGCNIFICSDSIGRLVSAQAEGWCFDTWGTNHTTFATLKEAVKNRQSI